MKKILSEVLAATAGLWAASFFIQGVVIKANAKSNFFGIATTQQWQLMLVLGISLGLLNYFAKPLLKTLALPLEIITLGLFTFVINAGLIWFLDYTFTEFSAPWMYPLLYTTLIVWAANLIINFIFRKEQ